jgi:hypothetical protein
MTVHSISRRDICKGSAAVAAAGACAWRGADHVMGTARAQAVTTQPAPISPASIAAARKEGKLAFYTAMDLPVAEKFGKAFEARFPGITVRVERSGAERVFQRIAQEMESRIHAVDVVNSADGAHFIVWKRNGWLAPHLPEEVAQHYPKQFYDPDGLWAILAAMTARRCIRPAATNSLSANDCNPKLTRLIPARTHAPAFSASIVSGSASSVTSANSVAKLSRIASRILCKCAASSRLGVPPPK